MKFTVYKVDPLDPLDIHRGLNPYDKLKNAFTRLPAAKITGIQGSASQAVRRNLRTMCGPSKSASPMLINAAPLGSGTVTDCTRPP